MEKANRGPDWGGLKEKETNLSDKIIKTMHPKWSCFYIEDVRDAVRKLKKKQQEVYCKESWSRAKEIKMEMLKEIDEIFGDALSGNGQDKLT